MMTLSRHIFFVCIYLYIYLWLLKIDQRIPSFILIFKQFSIILFASIENMENECILDKVIKIKTLHSTVVLGVGYTVLTFLLFV